MQFEGATIREQGQTFQVVIVRKNIIDNPSEARELIEYLNETLFPDIPVVLMAQDIRGTPMYYGRPDIAKFMANVSIERIPWQRYTASE